MHFQTRLARAGWLLATFGALVGFYLVAFRPWMHTWGATPAERTAPLPGDDIVPAASSQETRAITVKAPAPVTFAWVAQTGQDRGGFYSFDVLEDLVGCEMPDVQRLDPALQSWKLGDKLWMYPPHKLGGVGGVPLVRLEPGRALGFAMRQIGTPADAPADGSWTFVVAPRSVEESRLVIRGRGLPPQGLGAMAFSTLVFEPAHFAMERRMLEEIATLAEGGRVPRLPEDLHVLLWTLTFVAFVASGVLVLMGRRPRRRLVTFAAAGLVFQLLTLVQPPLLLGVPLVLALLGAVWLRPARDRAPKAARDAVSSGRPAHQI